MGSFYIKCGCCGKVTKVDIPNGFLNSFPINIPCKNCNTSLVGEVLMDNRCVTLNFINADVTKDGFDYEANFSGEFPSLKVNNVYNDEKSEEENNKPFTSKMKDIDKFYLSIKEMKDTYDNWPSYHKIFKLSLDNLVYVNTGLTDEYFDFKKEDDILRTVHRLGQNALAKPLFKNYLNQISLSKSVYQLDFDELMNLVEFLNERYGYSISDMSKDIISVLNDFVNKFPSLIPSFSLEFINKNIDYPDFYTSTSDFEEIKDLYIKTYDVLSKLLIVPLSLNNIFYRFKYSYFTTIGMTKYSIDDFINLPDEENFKYCSELEKYTSCLILNFNINLAKGIKRGHYTVDKVEQKIKYRAHQKDYFGETTLLELEKDLIDMTKDIMLISEFIYRIRQASLINRDINKGEVKRASEL